MSKQIDFKSAVSKLRTFHGKHKRLPSFFEIQRLLGYASKSGVARLIDRLSERGILGRDRTGRLIPTPLFDGGLRLLGSVQAGFPSPAEEELLDVISLDEFLVQKKEASFLVKVTGDSMIEAGIMPGDIVIVEKGKDPGQGDVVIAQVDGEWTMKYYLKQGRQVVLKAANKKYPPIKPNEELVIGGVVVASIRKYAKR